jgi:hypothetical protein
MAKREEKKANNGPQKTRSCVWTKRRTMIHRKLEVVCEQKDEQWSTEN